MRTIKFRAWSKYAESMYSWEEIENSSKSYLYQSFQDAEESGYTFMQYTGLKDKNGKEIYEGDIVRGGKCDGQVEWDEDGYIVNPFPSNAFATQLRNENKFIEIIGNIYENPELLVQLDK